MNKEELIEVPEEIYNDIERYEKGVFYAKASTIWAILDNMKNGSYQTSTDEWLSNHDTELIDAVVYGCKPMKKKWVVIKDNGHWKTYLKAYSASGDFGFVNHEFNREKNGRLVFTGKAKAEAMATLVGGKVEEL